MPFDELVYMAHLQLHWRLLVPAGVLAFEEMTEEALLYLHAVIGVEVRPVLDAVRFEPFVLGGGARESFELSPGEAFGERNPELLQRVKLSLLREHGDPDASYHLGDVVQFPTPDGQGGYAGVVREVGPDWLLFDFNHPLAGQPVRFDVHLIGVL